MKDMEDGMYWKMREKGGNGECRMRSGRKSFLGWRNWEIGNLKNTDGCVEMGAWKWVQEVCEAEFCHLCTFFSWGMWILTVMVMDVRRLCVSLAEESDVRCREI